jgi:pyruvate-formate lyase-activating enzyme
VTSFPRPSLLVIPGYIDRREVRIVAERLAALDPAFTLKLIAFLPRYRMTDLPAAGAELLASLAGEARRAGLRNVSPAEDGGGRPCRFVRGNAPDPVS